MTKCALDCDPGHDDLAMIMLAVYSPKLDVQFISTVHGNQTVDKTYINARRTLTLIKRADRIPVYRGYSKPLVRSSVVCPEIHGESGLGGVDWSSIDSAMPRNPALDLQGYSNDSQLQPTDFFNHLHRLIAESPDRFDLIVTGSQTNIAQYLMAFPADASKLRITVMAGNFTVIGNISPFAEFNVLIDPEATRYILSTPVDYVFAAPLDITHTVLVTSQVLDLIRAATEPYSTEFAKTIVSLLVFFKDTYKTVFQFEDPPLHDPIAAFHLIAPEAFEHIQLHVDIETAGEFTAGACCSNLVEKRRKPEKSSKPDNATVCLKLKPGGLDLFWKCMIDTWGKIAQEVGGASS
jgi:inosine-uridine nucleoside N-ribohydrolase